MVWNNFLLFFISLSLVQCSPLPEQTATAVQDAANTANGITNQNSSAVSIAGGIVKSLEAISPIQAPIVHRETVRLEKEAIPSKVLAVYDNSQSKVSQFFNPKPIVDTIQEHEKYGNTGDKFLPVGRGIISGYEGFSNFLNKLLDTPVEIAKQFSRGITNQLNLVGGKIVGLN